MAFIFLFHSQGVLVFPYTTPGAVITPLTILFYLPSKANQTLCTYRSSGMSERAIFRADELKLSERARAAELWIERKKVGSNTTFCFVGVSVG
jgi:hypothetical protein